MKAMEIKNILDRIQANRPSFMVTDNVAKEWRNVLEDYDYKDVDDKLTDFFKDERNFGRYPDPYYITKYLKTEVEKSQPGFKNARCKWCKAVVSIDNLKSHEERCSSVDYLISESQLYLNKKLNREKLMSATQESFDEYYYNTCYQIYNVLDENNKSQAFKKHLLKNVLLTREGKEPEYTLETLIKEIGE